MVKILKQNTTARWLHLSFGLLLVISFFLPWVEWDGSLIKGYEMATGHFFSVSETRFGLANPLPQLSFTFYIFWLIPLLGILSAGLILLKKKTIPFSFFAGALSLALVTIYYLFSNTLADLGVSKNAVSMLKPGFYIHILSGAGLVSTAFPVKNPLAKIFWILLGPVVAFASFKFIEKKAMNETYMTTADVKTDYTVSAESLLKEFTINDTTANKKYLNKVLVVTGPVSAVEFLPDSSSTIKFADSTGSYAIFSLEKSEFSQVKEIKTGDPVSLKGVCSGSIYSEILATTSVSFKRSTLHKK